MIRLKSAFFFLLPLLLLIGSCCGAGERTFDSEEALVTYATNLHEGILTIDTHDDISPDFATEKDDPGQRDGRQVTLPKMREGGLDAEFFVVYFGQGERTPEGYAEAKKGALTKFEAIHRMAEELYPEQIEMAYAADDFERINRTGRLISAIGIENGYVIGKDLSLIESYHDLGARYFSFTHMGHNDISDSSNPSDGEPEEEHGGLSAFGEDVVKELNRVGMMVDVSHVSKNAMLDALRITKAPIIASHSGVRALCDTPRNMDDEQLLALKKNGGVIQIVGLSSYLKETPPEVQEARDKAIEEAGIQERSDFAKLTTEEQQALRARLREISLASRATITDFVDHIDYAVDLIGVDHVGVGSDFDGGGGIEGFSDASEAVNVTIELVRRGYTNEDIEQIWGGNLLRVMREVERVSEL